MAEQGWYHDPYHKHEDRYFSDGQPTKLVRDGETEAYEEPPPEPVPEELEPVETVPAAEGSDLLRADAAQDEPPVDRRTIVDAAMDSSAIWAPPT